MVDFSALHQATVIKKSTGDEIILERFLGEIAPFRHATEKFWEIVKLSEEARDDSRSPPFPPIFFYFSRTTPWPVAHFYLELPSCGLKQLSGLIDRAACGVGKMVDEDLLFERLCRILDHDAVVCAGVVAKSHTQTHTQVGSDTKERNGTRERSIRHRTKRRAVSSPQQQQPSPTRKDARLPVLSPLERRLGAQQPVSSTRSYWLTARSHFHVRVTSANRRRALRRSPTEVSPAVDLLALSPSFRFSPINARPTRLAPTFDELPSILSCLLSKYCILSMK